ncbi:hypothetical protein N7507_010427 [Penicillium longicatenatum]|nr:hypothetical protein N7507_010427 [Penicillium longicatenatum]
MVLLMCEEIEKSSYHSQIPYGGSALRPTGALVKDKDLLEPIAVVGYCFRFPGDAVDDEGFWRLMMEKRCAMTQSSADRWNVAGWYHPDKRRRGQFTPRGGHFLKEDVSLFDAGFFSFSADEASALDPQQRQILEVTYGALENAGIPMARIAGSQTSVHVGCFGSDYRLMACKDVEMSADYDVVGINACMNANRVSWFFDLHGTSMNIDTACSSSLVAMDLACQGLQSGDADMGIVAGTNMILSPDMMQVFSNVNMLSPDSRSHSFDHRANGYGRGEGTGTLILKRLRDAIRDGDTIRAVVRATGSNQDGLTPSGIMQPSGASQAQLIRRTYEKAGLSMEPTSFFEAHGTGTPVGDPIECNAIGEAFRGMRRCSSPGIQEPLIVGAVKSNIGHLEGASGIAAIIKTIMVLEKGLIPPNANFERLNPKIDLEFLNLKLPHQPTPWPTRGLRRASVNSFGFGGSNAHVILDDAFHFLQDHHLVANHVTVEVPATLAVSETAESTESSRIQPPGNLPKLLVFSASSKEATKNMVHTYQSHFEMLSPRSSHSEYLGNLAYTLNLRRTTLDNRTFFIASRFSDLKNIDNLVSPIHKTLDAPVLGFVFSGQGAQWPGMGRELWGLSGFRNTIDNCEKALRSFGCPWSLREECLVESTSRSRIHEPEVAQPANTALQIALFDLLDGLGIRPAASIGHSSGEIAAAYAVGALNLQDAMKVAYFRGLCAGQLARDSGTSGGMMAVGLSVEETEQFIDKVANFCCRKISIACVNSQKSVTVSGDRDQIEILENLLHAEGIFARKLKIPVAYHSSHMNLVAGKYREQMMGIGIGRQIKPVMMVSSVTGKKVKLGELGTPDYWVANLVSPVRFTDAFFEICSGRRIRKKLDCSHRSQASVNILLEIGPHSALQGPIRDMLDTLPWGRDMRYCPTLRRKENATHQVLAAVGQLHCLGIPVNMESVNRLTDPSPVKHPRVLVDLPRYPFNHTNSYWRESRASKRGRLREPRYDLIGQRVPDWNPLEARWRHHIRVTEMPWVEDHVIGGTLIYPGAGMVVMAIEAADQMVNDADAISGFELKAVKFQRALVIPRTAEGVETSLLLRTMNGGERPTSWMEFRLCSWQNDAWEEHCHGYIRVDHQSASNDTEQTRVCEAWSQRHDQLEHTCTSKLVDDDIYTRLHGSGFQFGPAFQTVTGAKCNGREAIALVKVFQWPEMEHPQNHIIHPTTLDGILHLSSVALMGDAQIQVPAAIPTGIGSLWVARKGINGAVDRVQASAWMKSFHNRGHAFDACAMNEKRLLVQVHGLQSTIVGGATSPSTEQEVAPLTAFRLNRVADLNTMDTAQLIAFCGQAISKPTEPVEFFRDLNFVLYKFLADALTAITANHATSHSRLPHVQRYVDWATLQKEKYRAGELPLSRPEWGEYLERPGYFEAVCQRVSSSNGAGAAYVHTGRNLLKILEGDQDPLEFLFNGDMMAQWYSEVNNRPCFKPWGLYLQTAARKNPNMRILEIGAGTGGSTRHILKALSSDCNVPEESALYKCYDYTDISPAFFERAADRFAKYPHLHFRILNIEQDPAEQGYELGSYDLIIAANVLHATPCIGDTLNNVHSLLKADGKLMLFEVTHPEIIRSGFIAGLMQGWWAGVDDGRVNSPALTVDDWDGALKGSGFHGIEAVFPEFDDTECHEMDIIVANASGTQVRETKQTRRSFYFIMHCLSGLQQEIFNRVREALLLHYPGSQVVSGSLEECAASDLMGATVVCLEETERPMLSNMTRATFTSLQTLINGCNSILWVTAGGGHDTMPEYGLVDGWTRTLRNEKATRRICTLALDLGGEILGRQINHIMHVMQGSLLADPTSDYEPEFLEIDGTLHTLRLEPDLQLTEGLHLASQPLQSSIQPLADLSSARLLCGTSGVLTSLHWADEDDIRLIQPDDVIIKVAAVGVTLHDVLSVTGKIPDIPLGLECAGTVVKAGHSCVGLQPGDRVLAFGPGKFRTMARAKQDFVFRIPSEIPLTHAAAIPMAFGTAWHLLVTVGRLRRTHTVLVHDGTSSLGQAAIQLARYLGAMVYTTFDTEEKRQWLFQQGMLPSERILDARDVCFASGLMRATDHGADIVINFAGGKIQCASWECVAPYGLMIQVGHQSSGLLPLAHFSRQASLTYFDDLQWISDKPDMLREAINEVLPLLTAGHVNLSFCHMESACLIEEIFRSVQDGTNPGKTVIDLTVNVEVPTVFKTKNEAQLQASATYVISGGLGGLGRATARWMVSQGARNLVLLGRSGPTTEAARILIDELSAQGVTVQAPPCDIIDTQSVQSVMGQVMQTMPPIKGLIQASMVLRDCLFSEMRFDDWHVAVECKALGSKNLAEALPPLDFFIMFSSASNVVGLTGQSNYAAGNSYMDSFARHLAFHGQQAVSLDLGPMIDDGVLVETEGFLDKVLQYGSLAPVSREQFFALLSHYCNPMQVTLTPGNAQLVFGVSGRGGRQVENPLTDKPLFKRLKLEEILMDPNSVKSEKADFKKLFLKTTSLQKGCEIIGRALIDKMVHSYRLIPEDVDVDEFLADVAVLEIMGGSTFAMVELLVATRSQLRHPQWV